MSYKKLDGLGDLHTCIRVIYGNIDENRIKPPKIDIKMYSARFVIKFVATLSGCMDRGQKS